MKIRFESLPYAFKRRCAVWTAGILLFAALCVLAAFSGRDALDAAADPAPEQSDSSVYYSPNPASSQETDLSRDANSAIFKESETFYTVRAFEGSVAIFKNGEKTPVYRIKTPLSSLTEEDRSLLNNGITAKTLTEARKLIEDYE